ncbi:MAG: hypothetical protein M1817_006062 [Caeruleum heppii]|nr:MAG: hypothetical protein M1817_006062 [Caeruleum heppii]
MPYSLKDRNVLITGGSRGLGALVAEKFASEGCNIAINYVSSKERAEQTAQKIQKSYGAKVTIIQGCWAVNVKGQMFLFREALQTFKANPDGGVFLITSSIAGVSIAGSSMAYSTTKAAGLHLMKCLAQTQGAKVRVNAVLPGLLMTEWGEKFPAESITAIKEKAVLKDVVRLWKTCNQTWMPGS